MTEAASQIRGEMIDTSVNNSRTIAYMYAEKIDPYLTPFTNTKQFKRYK